MHRRDFLFRAAIAGTALGLGWARDTRACGSAAELTEEEFLDIGPLNSEGKRELAHFFTAPPLRAPNERFCAGPGGQGLVFAELEGVGVLSPSGKRTRVSAPEGARLAFDSQNARVIIRTVDSEPHDQIFVFDPQTEECELWGQVWTVKDVQPTSVGLVVSHREFGLRPDRLSLLERKGVSRELRQFGFAPAALCALGARLVYFEDEVAYALDLTKSDDPKVIGKLPASPDAVVLTRQGITALVNDAVWRLLPNGNCYQLFAAEDVFTLFSEGDAVIVASPSRVWVHDGHQLRTIEAHDANLHYVAPIDGSPDLILCRGPAVLRYSQRTGRTEHIGTGRPKMKLNGAAIVGGELFTWSSRTWVTTGHSCSALPPPRAYAIE